MDHEELGPSSCGKSIWEKLFERSNDEHRPVIEKLEDRRLLSADVLTFHTNGMRTGLDAQETILTPANVASGQFGKLSSVTLDGNTYAQPLYVSGLTIGGRTRNVVFVATEHDSVYAFDADAPGAPLWHVSFINPAAGVTTFPNIDTFPETGITGTPVIDAATGTLYVVAATREASNGAVNYVQRLHALDIRTGQEKFGGPTLIRASVAGNGIGNVKGVISFDARNENQRSALALANGRVYVAWASHDDTEPSHGWLIGFDAATLEEVQVFNFSPRGHLASVWQSGGGPAVDASGNLFLVTGNGTYDANVGGPDWGETVMRFDTSGSNLVVRDWFTPSDYQFLNGIDRDFGSGGVMLLPDLPGVQRHEALVCGKQGILYLLDRDNLGHFNPLSDHVLQTIQLPTGVYSTPAYFDGAIYTGPINGHILRYALLPNGMLATTPSSMSTEKYGFPGVSPVISADGTSNGIVWSLATGAPGALCAYDAADLSRTLYSSATLAQRDGTGVTNKFTVPIVADGHVYVAGGGALSVYGLIGDVGSPPAAPTGAAAAAPFPTRVDLKWSPHSTDETGFRVLRSLDNIVFSQIDLAPPGSTQLSDTSAEPSTTYYYRIVATNAAGDSAPAATGPVTTPAQASVVTLSPAADAYVRGGSSAMTNFGADPTLQVKTGPVRLTRVAYLSFDLASVADAKTVKLRLFGRINSTAPKASVPVALFGAPGAGWTEDGVTYANAPATGATALGTASITPGAGQWFEFDVTAYVRAQLAGGATHVGFALRGAAKTNLIALFNSREAESNPPELVVST